MTKRQESFTEQKQLPFRGGHRFYFEEKPPIIFVVLMVLLFANTLLGLFLDFGAKYIFPRASATMSPCEALSDKGVQFHVPAVVCWQASRFIPIQFVLLGLLALVILIFHKRVRYLPPPR
jgi:hypothetical protein